jgi:hypothetical protein
MNDPVLDAIRDRIQLDVNNRGLRSDPARNLCNALPEDFAATCRALTETRNAHLAVVTGFLIPTADPPAGETDGPLGAVFMARTLIPLGIRITLLSDAFCVPALQAGLSLCGFADRGRVVELPPHALASAWTGGDWRRWLADEASAVTHLLALERVGPSHTSDSLGEEDRADFLAEVPAAHRGRCQTMRGRDITECMSPVQDLFDELLDSETFTIGIGDGGNEIGMGRLPWSVIRANIPRGGLIACRTRTRRLIVAGISNWGAYGLAAGVHHLRGVPFTPDIELERAILQRMVDVALVDGVLGKRSCSVDGLEFDRYGSILSDLRVDGTP